MSCYTLNFVSALFRYSEFLYLFGYVELWWPYWYRIWNFSKLKFQFNQNIYLPSSLSYWTLKSVAWFRSYSNFFEDFSTLSDILNFVSHTGTNVKFSKVIYFSPIEIPFKQAIEHWNRLHNSWVIATFWKIFRLSRPFWTSTAILVKKYVSLCFIFS